jgi:hypothetical protein
MTRPSRSNNMESHKDTVRILVLNPNSSTDMTHGVEEAIKSINLPRVSLSQDCVDIGFNLVY